LTVATWPTTAEELEAAQAELARFASDAEPWRPDPERPLAVGGVFFASPSGSEGVAGEPAWAAAAVVRESRAVAEATVAGDAPAPYRSGYLALREGPLVERAVRALATPPDVLLVNASGRDHPRHAGLALHLGAVLALPTVGVTDRPLLAEPAAEPGDERGDAVPLIFGAEPVGLLLRTRRRERPVCVHAAWRTDPGTARDVVLAVTGRARTPEPLRLARFLARIARAGDEGRLPDGWRRDAAPISPRGV
jgi:deoxyribonuclease V